MSDDNHNRMSASSADAQEASAPQSIGISAVSGQVIEGLLYLYEIMLADGQIARLYADDMPHVHLTFAEQIYHAHPIEAEGFGWEPGQLSHSPILRLSMIDLPLNIDASYDNIRGGSCKRIITFASECDPPIGEGGGSSFPPESWQIDRLERLDGQTVQLALVPAAHLDGQFLPKRMMLRDICQHRYRRWDTAKGAFDYQDATCPYVKDSYFTQSGVPTDDPARDSCSLRMKDGCKKRFAGDLPFFAFPGLAR